MVKQKNKTARVTLRKTASRLSAQQNRTAGLFEASKEATKQASLKTFAGILMYITKYTSELAMDGVFGLHFGIASFGEQHLLNRPKQTETCCGPKQTSQRGQTNISVRLHIKQHRSSSNFVATSGTPDMSPNPFLFESWETKTRCRNPLWGGGGQIPKILFMCVYIYILYKDKTNNNKKKSKPKRGNPPQKKTTSPHLPSTNNCFPRSPFGASSRRRRSRCSASLSLGGSSERFRRVRFRHRGLESTWLGAAHGVTEFWGSRGWFLCTICWGTLLRTIKVGTFLLAPINIKAGGGFLVWTIFLLKGSGSM